MAYYMHCPYGHRYDRKYKVYKNNRWTGRYQNGCSQCRKVACLKWKRKQRNSQALIPIAPVRLMVQSLRHLGYTAMDLQRETGIRYDEFYRWSSETTRRRHVQQSKANAIRAAFDRLSGTPGPSPAARDTARRHGWRAPLDLTDKEITW